MLEDHSNPRLSKTARALLCYGHVLSIPWYNHILLHCQILLVHTDYTHHFAYRLSQVHTDYTHYFTIPTLAGTHIDYTCHFTISTLTGTHTDYTCHFTIPTLTCIHTDYTRHFTIPTLVCNTDYTHHFTIPTLVCTHWLHMPFYHTNSCMYTLITHIILPSDFSHVHTDYTCRLPYKHTYTYRLHVILPYQLSYVHWLHSTRINYIRCHSPAQNVHRN